MDKGVGESADERWRSISSRLKGPEAASGRRNVEYAPARARPRPLAWVAAGERRLNERHKSQV